MGCGEFTAVETLAEIIKNYKKKYPMVQIAIHTGAADTILEKILKNSMWHLQAILEQMQL